MRIILPQGGHRLGVLVFMVVLGAPALAQAQLFPNLPLHKRQRPDCANENPQYKMIRQEYWGYYPTCWRRFPAGWGCPSPDAPNWEQAKRDLPLDKFPDEEGLDGGTFAPEAPQENSLNPPPTEPNLPVRPPALPELPTDVDSPFNRPVTPPGAAPEIPPAGAPPADPPAATAESRPRRGRTMISGLLSSRKR